MYYKRLKIKTSLESSVLSVPLQENVKRLESEIAALRRELTQVDGEVTRSSRDRASESESEDEFQLALESIPSQRYPALILVSKSYWGPQ